ncbi:MULTISPECIES: hypothetical protein [Desulfosediminicola]|uniref:hypothetical protein n=1 Tax=Desulfosediminicola TaxID=2886823 RepID=UPI0010AD9D4F|nr:hypothetical protein [Desulfosediminicola ganghwensis]
MSGAAVHMRSINIPKASSGKGLREEIKALADARAVTVSKIFNQVLGYALKNREDFPGEISPREKPGRHIATKVSVFRAEELREWAEELGRSRTAHCCFLLEAVMADEELKKKVFPS